jgi:hypothetical protein
VKLRVRRLLLALGGLLGLFIGLPLAIGYAMNVLPVGTFEVVLAAAALLCTFVVWLRPDLGPRVWGTSSAAGLLLTLALVSMAVADLHVVPESVAQVARWVGVGLFGAMVIGQRMRSKSEASRAA